MRPCSQPQGSWHSLNGRVTLLCVCWYWHGNSWLHSWCCFHRHGAKVLQPTLQGRIIVHTSFRNNFCVKSSSKAEKIGRNTNLLKKDSLTLLMGKKTLLASVLCVRVYHWTPFRNAVCYFLQELAAVPACAGAATQVQGSSWGMCQHSFLLRVLWVQWVNRRVTWKCLTDWLFASVARIWSF